jgi:hypothetical protein
MKKLWKNGNIVYTRHVSINSSKQEKEFFNILKQYVNVKQKHIIKYINEETKRKRHLFPDGYIEELNLIIEFNGSFWHADKRLYPNEDTIVHHNISAGEIRKGNINKKELYEIYQLISKHTDTELNSLPYKLAINLDKRSYCVYYVSLIKTKHLVFFSFLPIFDYNSRILKIFLFFFNFTVTFIVNALFFNDDTMHKIYVDHGSYDFIYNIPQILYSSIISGVINGIIKILALSYSSFMELKNNTNKKNIESKSRVIINILKIKFAIFFIISLILLIMFWFYLACFCAVYKNTQIHLIKDTLISFGTSMIYPFFINLIPGILRIYSINRRNKEYVYKISKILQLI